MEFDFQDDHLRTLCETSAKAQRELGQPCARKLKSRLADLAAAAHVGELVAGRPHPLKGDKAGQFSLSLQGGKRLVFEPAMDPVPTLGSGGIAWNEVTRVRIIFIGDYHD